MITYIDVVTGFLESGKTTFIKDIIKSKQFAEYEQVTLVVCEEGLVEYEEEAFEKHPINTIILDNESDLTDDLFMNIFDKYESDYILMEFNGTWDITKLLGLKLPFNIKFRNVIFMSEAETFGNYLSNMASIMQPHIINSDMVIFNRYEKINTDIRKKLHQNIKNINSNTRVFFYEDFEKDRNLKDYFVPFEKHNRISLDLKLTTLALLCIVLLCLSFVPIFTLKSMYVSLQSIGTVFLSVLMQAIPFVLLGAFISAIIQIFVPTGWIINQFSKGNWLSFIFAAIAGFFIPVCDCGMVPIVSGLLKKGTPLPQTTTFWLASASVNPIVIISILYAFPEKPHLAVVRVIAGVIIGIIVGLILKLLRIETKNVIKENGNYQKIGRDIMDLKYEGTSGKIEAVFQGAKIEFFRVAEYVIVGALISSIFQTILPQTMKSFIGGNIIIQFIIMIVAAMFMSTCSTSNAFIGRSFSSSFSIVPIMLFITMGPMLDFKNMIMLSEIIKKRHLLILACLVILVGAGVFSVLGIFL